MAFLQTQGLFRNRCTDLAEPVRLASSTVVRQSSSTKSSRSSSCQVRRLRTSASRMISAPVAFHPGYRVLDRNVVEIDNIKKSGVIESGFVAGNAMWCRFASGTWILVFAAVCLAQPGSTSLSGTVSYPSGAPVPNAPIQIRNNSTGVVARFASTPDGRYSFSGLVPGVWNLSIVMPCCAYQRVNREFTLQTAKSVQLNISLVETINGSTLGDDPARLADAIRKRARVPSGATPRTGSGKPDLSGVWLFTDDPYPEQPDPLPWAAARIGQLRENSGKDSPHNYCLPGPPPAPGSTAPFLAKFVQLASLVVILLEDYPGFRQIFLDGRAHPSDWNPSWMGHSVGRWEKDVLVVDTAGFNDRGFLGGIGGGAFPRSEKLHMTERYHRTDTGHMELNIIFDDPGAYTKPIRENLKMDLAPREEVLEYVCENNKPEHLVGGR
jgi:hypothetical protein